MLIVHSLRHALHVIHTFMYRSDLRTLLGRRPVRTTYCLVGVDGGWMGLPGSQTAGMIKARKEWHVSRRRTVLVLSPTDLVGFLYCDHLTELSLLVARHLLD